MTGLGVDKIQRRAGHENIATIIGYVKQAEDLGGELGDPFGALPAALLGRIGDPEWANDWARIESSAIAARKNRPETLRRGRDSKPNNATASEPFSEDLTETDDGDGEAARDNPAEGTRLSPFLRPYADAVDAALARTLEAAARAGRFDVVAQLARELEARRLAQESNVIRFDPVKSSRGTAPR